MIYSELSDHSERQAHGARGVHEERTQSVRCSSRLLVVSFIRLVQNERRVCGKHVELHEVRCEHMVQEVHAARRVHAGAQSEPGCTESVQ